jgi:hypothetical protein
MTDDYRQANNLASARVVASGGTRPMNDPVVRDALAEAAIAELLGIDPIWPEPLRHAMADATITILLRLLGYADVAEQWNSYKRGGAK